MATRCSLSEKTRSMEYMAYELKRPMAGAYPYWQARNASQSTTRVHACNIL